MSPQEEHLVEYFPFAPRPVVEFVNLSPEIVPPRTRITFKRQETEMREHLQRKLKFEEKTGLPQQLTDDGAWDLRFCIQNTHSRLLRIGSDVLLKKFTVCL
jgi:hypothetical protein